MENHSGKFLLLSNDPDDVGFVSGIAVSQHARLEMVTSLPELFSRAATNMAHQSLSGIFVDVSSSAQLHQFEHLIQTHFGVEGSLKFSSFVHFLSSKPLALNREILQSPYFSFYSERKPIRNSALDSSYLLGFRPASGYRSDHCKTFDRASRGWAFDELKKEFLSRKGSIEWILQFRKPFMEMIESMDLDRFETSVLSLGTKMALHLCGEDPVSIEKIRAEKFLGLGTSVLVSQNEIVFLIPILNHSNEYAETFSFLKVEK